MRRLATVLLGALLTGCGCSLAGGAPAKLESATPPPLLWVEGEPSVEPDSQVDSSAWNGIWTEYYAGRPICQDRFTLRAQGITIDVESVDCTNDRPYTITAVRWDGRTLRFFAEPPGGGTALKYEVELRGPGQIEGTANGTPIAWSRTN